MQSFEMIYDVTGYDDLVAQYDILQRIENLRLFEMSIAFPKLISSFDQHHQRDLMLALYSAARKSIASAEFRNLAALKTNGSSSEITVDFGDEKNHFKIELTTANLRIRRSGGTLQEFHHWYVRLVPTLQTVWTTVQHQLEMALGISLPPLSVSYGFSVILEDIRGMSGLARNTAVIAKVIPEFPNYSGTNYETTSGQGKTIELSRAQDELSRMDIKFGRRVSIAPNDDVRYWWYTIEAPANRDWSTLWFQFSYNANSDENESSNRVEGCFEEWAQAFEVFFIDSCLSGLCARLLESVEFQTRS